MRSRSKKMVTTVIFAAIVAMMMMVGSASAFGPSTMYSSPGSDPSPGSLYARALRLQHSGSSNGTMLATFEHYVNGTPSFPIYRSTDGGVSWSLYSEVEDDVNGWGLRYQPFLYELPQQIGNMPAGTILAAGNSIPGDLSQTKLDLYKSTDHGATWSFVSSIASGGRAEPTGTYDPVWEPFLLVANNKLIMYYSDERDSSHNQKLVHQTSTDGVNWGSVVNDIALASDKRPGMPTVAQMGNGDYIMTYEYGGSPSGNFAVYYKISSNPENFGSASDPGTVLRTQDGVVPTSSPYVVWLSGTGTNGTIAVSANSSSDLFVNSNNGASGSWTRVSTVVDRGYSRALVPLADNHSVFIVTGGYLGGGHNSVTYGSKDLGGGGSTYIRLKNRATGLYIDGMGRTANGSNAGQWSDSGSYNQHWTIEPDGSYVRLKNRATGLYLDGMGRTTNGDDVGQWGDSNHINQQWSQESAGNYVKFKNRATGLYLDGMGRSTNGDDLGQWSGNGSYNQQWQIAGT